MSILSVAERQQVDAVVVAGDLFPTDKGGNLIEIQKVFIETTFVTFCSLADKIKIPVLCCLGNDDLVCNEKLFNNIIFKHQYVRNVTRKKITLKGFEFIGFDLVVDYPFRLKDRCRLDNDDDVSPKLKNGAYITINGSWEKVSRWPSEVKQWPTLEKELGKLVAPINFNKAIYIIHMPPTQLGFDLCFHGKEVGSTSVYSFLNKHQPLLSLHGHIHESPEYSNKWKGEIGKTICIQPGQSKTDLIYAIIKVSDKTIVTERVNQRLERN